MSLGEVTVAFMVVWTLDRRFRPAVLIADSVRNTQGYSRFARYSMTEQLVTVQYIRMDVKEETKGFQMAIA